MKKRIFLCIMLISFTIAVVCIAAAASQTEKKNDFDKIKSGDFSVVAGIDESTREALETIYQNQKEGGDKEWVSSDLNNDGIEELIWRDISGYPSEYIRSITAVFTDTKEGCGLILFDTVDVTEFYAAENNHLFYYWQFYSIYSYASYTEYKMDENYELIKDKTLDIFIMPAYEYLIEEWGKEWADDFMTEYPFINGEGNYYRSVTYAGSGAKEDILNKQEWMNGLEGLLGVPLHAANKDLYELIYGED